MVLGHEECNIFLAGGPAWNAWTRRGVAWRVEGTRSANALVGGRARRGGQWCSKVVYGHEKCDYFGQRFGAACLDEVWKARVSHGREKRVNICL